MKWLKKLQKLMKLTKNINHSHIRDKEFEYLKMRIEFLEKMLEEKTHAVEIAKSNFLKNIYHEIRTPLNAIIGFTNLIELNDAGEKENAVYMTHIKDSSRNFLSKMDNIIEASIIEAGIVKIYNDDCRLFSLLSELHSYFTIHKHLYEKDIAFLLTVPNELRDVIVQCDINRIKQVIMNLLVNAFKFTEKGIVEVGFKIINDEIEFFVRDSGIGGLEGKEDTVYGIFSKLDNSDTSFEGMGLGLRLAKRLVELMEGQIRYTSVTNKGTTFYFTIPYRPVTKHKTVLTPNYLSQTESITKMISKGAIAI